MPILQRGNLMKSSTSKTAARIRKLAQIAEDLHGGAVFSITRLTTVKSLCEDPEAAARFAVHLSVLTQAKMSRRPCPDHLDAAKWICFQELAADAVREMESYLTEPTIDRRTFRQLLSALKGAQNRYGNLQWGAVRIIGSRELLLIETALHCLLSPTESADWGYRVAKEYAERYEPRYGTGLIPESAPMVQEIAEFWCRYHFRQSLDKWLASSAP
jgi:hypothetical protein